MPESASAIAEDYGTVGDDDAAAAVVGVGVAAAGVGSAAGMLKDPVPAVLKKKRKKGKLEDKR